MYFFLVWKLLILIVDQRKGFFCAIANRTCYFFINRGSLKITCTVPLFNLFMNILRVDTWEFALLVLSVKNQLVLDPDTGILSLLSFTNHGSFKLINVMLNIENLLVLIPLTKLYLSESVPLQTKIYGTLYSSLMFSINGFYQKAVERSLMHSNFNNKMKNYH